MGLVATVRKRLDPWNLTGKAWGLLYPARLAAKGAGYAAAGVAAAGARGLAWGADKAAKWLWRNPLGTAATGAGLYGTHQLGSRQYDIVSNLYAHTTNKYN